MKLLTAKMGGKKYTLRSKAFQITQEGRPLKLWLLTHYPGLRTRYLTETFSIIKSDGVPGVFKGGHFP